MPVEIRKAAAADQAAIVALVRSERLNPNGLDWRNFCIASEGDGLAGAVQIRRHKDGRHQKDEACELGSLVVAPGYRGHGLAGRLIAHALSAETGPVHMITGRAFAAHYARWGFLPVEARRAPASVRRDYWLGQLIGGAHALITGRRINRLVILARNPAAQGDR